MYICRMGLLAKANATLEQERRAAYLAAAARRERAATNKSNTPLVVRMDGTAVTPTKFPSVLKGSALIKQYLNEQPTKSAVKEPRVELGQDEAQAVAWAAATVEDHQQKVKQNRFKKLKHLITAFAVGLTIAQTPLTNVARPVNQPTKLEVKEITPAEEAAAMKRIDQFAQSLGKVSNYERNVMAKMLYGEAGLGTDPFEVLHTVLNRKASPLFKGSIADIITQPGQYIGYKDTNPITPAFRRMVDIVVDDWEANGKTEVKGCDHYYFVTGIAGNCNKFEKARGNHGQWVAPRNKQYEKLRHYCPVAEQQATRYYQQYGHGNHRSM